MKLFNENVWRYGAEFLYGDECEWPSQEFIISKVDEMEKEKQGRMYFDIEDRNK